MKRSTIFRKSLLFLSLVLLVACSGRTRYTVEYRALSNIPQEYISREVNVPVNTDQYLYLMPFAAIAGSSSSIDIVLQRGTELQYPVPDVPEGGDLELSLDLGMDVENLSSTAALPDVTATLYIAEAESSNIYTEGTAVTSFSTGSVGPGATGRIDGGQTLTEGDPAWELLTSGDIRCGVEVKFTANTGSALQVGYTLERLGLRVSLYPFAYLP